MTNRRQAKGSGPADWHPSLFEACGLPRSGGLPREVGVRAGVVVKQPSNQLASHTLGC